MEENQAHIPEGWHLKQIQEFALKMRSGGTPKSDNPKYYNGNIPFVAIDDLTSANKYLEKTQKHITKEGLNNSAAWLVPINTIMYSIYATLGVPRINLVEAATNQAILNIIPDENKITLEFLFYLLLEKRSSILSHSAHTTQSNLNAKIVKELEFVFPKKTTEQTQIATVLSKVDEAITKTEQLIAKYARIKTGLMQDLLTKGIDENGNIRSEETHEFKDSPLGRIPNEWEVKRLDQITKSNSPIVYGILMPGKHFFGGVPVIKVKDIFDEKIHIEGLLHTNPVIADSFKRSKLKENDLLFTIRGTVGRCAFVPNELDGANITQDTARIRVQDEYKDYLRFTFETPESQYYIQLNTIGQAVKGINLKALRELNVLIPPPIEAGIIAKELNTSNNLIDVESLELSKLQSLKTGLMQDLLSGKVRVNHLIKETASV